MKISNDICFSRGRSNSNYRRIVSGLSRTELSSLSARDSHSRRLEVVRAEVAESLIRQRLLNLLKSDSVGMAEKTRTRVGTSKEEALEVVLKVANPKENPAFPTEDEGVDFSWIYSSGNEEVLGNYNPLTDESDDCPGIKLILSPFTLTKTTCTDELKEVEAVVEKATLPTTMYPSNVDVKSQQNVLIPESGSMSIDYVSGTESDSDSEIEMGLIDEDEDDDDF